ncbi:hypothetical protein [Sphaerothrix gracilis]|uniref:hypothetical protein n=1 Tax=Sphaerothrix gracilis TaxID=3151835 RepID=UPI0031FCFE69
MTNETSLDSIVSLDPIVSIRINDLVREIVESNVTPERDTYEVEISIREVTTGRVHLAVAGECVTENGKPGEWEIVNGEKVCKPL